MTQHKQSHDGRAWEIPYVIGTLALALLAVICWPSISGVIDRMRGPPVTQFLGTVQRIRFVGGFGRDTEVQTETGTFLLRGARHLAVGTPLERRQGVFGNEVCVVATDVCHELLSR